MLIFVRLLYSNCLKLEIHCEDHISPPLILPLFTCRVELEMKSHECGTDFRGSLGLSFGIFKMASLILIATRHETLCLSLTYAYLSMFCEIYRYPKHRKTLSRGKLIIINFTRSDMDNTKSGAVYD